MSAHPPLARVPRSANGADRAPGTHDPRSEPFASAASDAEHRALLLRIRARDREAMRQFYAQFHGRIARFLRPITTRAELVDEIVNDTLWCVWRYAGSFRGDSLVVTWVLSIARRQGLKRSRREWRRGAYEIASDAVEPAVEDSAELRDALAQALDGLPAEQRTAIELAYVGGYSCEEIGAVMGCPPNTVKTRLFHGRVKLRAALAAEPFGPRAVRVARSAG